MLNFPSQSNPNPIQFVIERRNLWSKKNTSCSREIVGKCLQEKLGSANRTVKLVKCEDNRVMQVHDRTVKLVELRTHTQCKKLILSNIVILHSRTRTSSTFAIDKENNRLQHLRRAERDGETIT